jgi:hypothetical protein
MTPTISPTAIPSKAPTPKPAGRRLASGNTGGKPPTLNQESPPLRERSRRLREIKRILILFNGSLLFVLFYKKVIFQYFN